jgi:molecular chaperone GrpE
MSEDEISAATDRLLAGIDFARATAASDEAHRLELERLLTGFLDVVDSLEALEVWSQTLVSDSAAGRGRSVERIRAQALRVLQGAGVEPIAAAGQPVDLTCSEVVELRSDPGVPVDTVLEVIVRGYRWRGRLLRRARVAISTDGLKGERQ